MALVYGSRPAYSALRLGTSAATILDPGAGPDRVAADDAHLETRPGVQVRVQIVKPYEVVETRAARRTRPIQYARFRFRRAQISAG